MFRFNILLDQQKFIENMLVQYTKHIGQVCTRHRKESLWRGDWSARILSQRALIALGKHLYRHKTLLLLSQQFNELECLDMFYHSVPLLHWKSTCAVAYTRRGRANNLINWNALICFITVCLNCNRRGKHMCCCIH